MSRVVFSGLLLLGACTRVVQVPQSAKPTPNRARMIAESFVASSDTKCILWTGRETPYPGVDSLFCAGPNQAIYVAAPADGPPVVKVFLQTEAPAAQPPPTTQPPKPEAKKK